MFCTFVNIPFEIQYVTTVGFRIKFGRECCLLGILGRTAHKLRLKQNMITSEPFGPERSARTP